MQVKVKRSAVLAFLLQSDLFPRSVLFCINEIERCLDYLPNNDKPLRQVTRIKRHVHQQEVQTLRQADIHDVIDDIQLEFGKVHHAVNERYFLSGMIVAEQAQSQSQSG